MKSYYKLMASVLAILYNKITSSEQDGRLEKGTLKLARLHCETKFEKTKIAFINLVSVLNSL